MIKYTTLLIGLLLIFGCNSKDEFSIQINEIQLQTKSSGEPNLSMSKQGHPLLSWIEYANDSLTILKFSKLINDQWSEPKEISRGSDWFVNWADFPSLINSEDDYLTAHWLQRSADGKYDYDIHISQSINGGQTWFPSFIPHQDSVNAEHGFVSMTPTSLGNTFLVWLDGRNSKKENNNAMTLRSAEISKNGQLIDERELDERVCDCCQTDVTWTKKGPVVVYRDRSNDEVRDISVLRKENDVWTKPKILHKDNWKITGCPVNGPSIDSKDDQVAVAWFTMANEKPRVYVSKSNNYGKSFSNPMLINEGSAIGRVDVIIDNSKTFVTWMENENDLGIIKMRYVDEHNHRSKIFKIGVNSVSRRSGFPRILNTKDGIIATWTETDDVNSKVKTFKINYNNG